MAFATITQSDDGTPAVQWGTSESFEFERGNDTSLIVALTKAVNFGIESGDEIEGEVAKAVADIIKQAQAGDVAWRAEAGYQDLLEDVQAAMPREGDNDYSKFSVRDIKRDGTAALVCSWDGGEDDHYVVPITIHGDGTGEDTVVVAGQSEWIPVEREFVVAKAGRVLSAKNLKLVQDAADALAALAQAAQREVDAEAGAVAKAAIDEGGVTYVTLEKKASDPMRYTFGPLYAPARKDAHGDWVEDDVLHKAVHEFVRESSDHGREINLQHGDNGEVTAGEWVEVARWPYDHTIVMKQADGTEKEVDMPAGTVYMGVVWGEDYWDAKTNRPKGLEGLSLGGRAVKVTGGDATMKAMGWRDTSKAATDLDIIKAAAEVEADLHGRELLAARTDGAKHEALVSKLIDTIKAATSVSPEAHLHFNENAIPVTLPEVHMPVNLEVKPEITVEPADVQIDVTG